MIEIWWIFNWEINAVKNVNLCNWDQYRKETLQVCGIAEEILSEMSFRISTTLVKKYAHWF